MGIRPWQRLRCLWTRWNFYRKHGFPAKSSSTLRHTTRQTVSRLRGARLPLGVFSLPGILVSAVSTCFHRHHHLPSARQPCFMCVWFLLRARGMIKEGLCGGITSITRTLPDGTLVLVVRMSNKQISETYRLIQDSSKNDSGFGMDEFPTEADFREEIAGGHCFAVLSKDTGQLIGAFILADSKFYRGQKVVDPFIIVRRTERGRGLGDFCFKMAVEQAIALKYIGMYVDTFTTNEAMIRIIEKTGGFERVGFLPMGGRDKDGNIVSSYIYYRDLRKR